MNKLLLILIMIIFVTVSCGCVNMKQAGADAAQGALQAAQDFGLKYSEKKNAAELNAAVVKGHEVGIEYDDIDTDGDGIYSGAEATSFAFRYGQIKFKDKAQPALEKLLKGDFKGAQIEAEKAGKGVVEYIKEAIIAIFMTGGTGKFLLDRHRKRTKEEVHGERNQHRRERGEPTHTLAGGEAPIPIKKEPSPI